ATKGLLVPDELTIRVWTHHVVGLKETGEFVPGYHVLLLDGIPRTPPQVELLRELIDVRKIVHLVIDDEQALIARLGRRAKKQNRPDDADPEVIRKRIAVYRRETIPVLEAYGPALVANVNAHQHPLAVLRDIAGLLTGVVPGNI
ncbi:MAG: nucleoside monophosphate kinase, partial [Planctomycetes bacterium]|nr:nucleoside monophosphate kinase [Planctomycetota bacterium]